MLLEITVSFEGPDAVLTVEGEVDLGSIDTLAACLEQTVESGSGRVCVDMTGVTFLDSTGLNVLLRAHQALAEAERELVLRRPAENVRRVLTVAAIDGVLKIED
ncbi:MAG: STAS domain-containing protein [Actinomycetota bacterium]|nr:STAS domain-containing protein [Actinomycetota bacterium]